MSKDSYRLPEIMAGGSGMRLWPLSPELHPKHDPYLPNRCRQLFQREYSVTHTMQQIFAALSA